MGLKRIVPGPMILRPGPSLPPFQSAGYAQFTTCLPLIFTTIVSPFTMIV
jgi:hypothetical protein